MTNYTLEPLMIVLNAPNGTYEVTVTINAETDTIFSVSEAAVGFVAEDREISRGTSTDIVFNTRTTSDSIVIEIYCDGDISATATATYTG